MQEVIVSPGVFTQENDLSFLPTGINEIGAVFIGPTVKGPAFIPTYIKDGFNDFLTKFGPLSQETYIPYAVKNYLSVAGAVTVVRILGNGGWYYDGSAGKLAGIALSGSTDLLTVFHPSKNPIASSVGATLELGSSSMAPNNINITGSTLLTLNGTGFSSGTGAKVLSASLNPNRSDYVFQSLGMSELNSKVGANAYSSSAFPYLNFKEYHTQLTSASLAGTAKRITFVTSSTMCSWSGSNFYTEGYQASSTPFITSQLQNGQSTDLFRFVHLSHGFSTNLDVKIAINGLREYGTVNGVDQYCTFNVLVRKIGDTDVNPQILEQFTNVNLDITSPNYIARVIGDRYFEYDSNLQKVVPKGNYPNASKFIRVEMNQAVDAGSVSPLLSPRGFRKYNETIIGFTGYNLPTASLKTSQFVVSASTYNPNVYLGLDFLKYDNYNYFRAVPVGSNGLASTGNNVDFNVDSLFGHPSSSYTGSLSASVSLAGITGPKPSQVQFIVGMQGGSDGMNPAIVKLMGQYISNTNTAGFDLSTSTSAGSLAYQKAFNILSNQDVYDFNLVATPGVIKQYHSAVTDGAISLVEGRTDCLYIMDLAASNASVTDAVNQVAGLDTNYAATYYPWVKVLDSSANRNVEVPPSTVIPRVIAYNDRNAAEWFAPAGLNRGVLSEVLATNNQLSQPERDTLYENRINAIATFPRTGVCVWGQKTLQVRSSALDRINVRRLLIKLRKFIASTSRYLVFEQNTSVTRNRFLNIVNPYLESVQQRQGLYAYRVVMDDTNNTASDIDQNRLVGSIYLQPTKTAEFIVLNFNILPTGASITGA